MAHDKTFIKAHYPLPAYNYRVRIGTDIISFSEVSGLSVEYESVTYKHGFSFFMGSKIIPGMRQPIKLTMKKGVMVGLKDESVVPADEKRQASFLRDWIKGAYGNPFFESTKRDIIIDLCDEQGNAVVSWTVSKALPIKLDAPSFDANSNEVAIETMEFIAHGLKVDYHPL